MEKNNDNTLLKIRSSQACIRDGYQLYAARFRRIFRHTWLPTTLFAVITALCSALPVLVSPALVLPAMALETVAVIVLLIVCGKLLHKCKILEKTDRVQAGTWMRHLGLVILVGIICLLIISVLTVFTSLPTIIMMAANWESQMGVIGGDPAGMPEYVRWLSVGAFLIAGFLQAYVWMSAIIPCYFVKVSVNLQEKERQAFNIEKS